jgi:hypothetical protein
VRPGPGIYNTRAEDGQCIEMAPSLVQNVTEAVSDLSIKTKGKTLLKEPLKSSGSLDQLPHEDLTPATGTEFSSSTQLSQLLKAENADELIRDLAILSISCCVSLI